MDMDLYRLESLRGRFHLQESNQFSGIDERWSPVYELELEILDSSSADVWITG
jgi:hypothetical protein